ncbi:MAG: hypothetical protein M1518_01395 [Candidatus Thermoplasmatota archaeon]|nr:hypothetical protein [Candidatus Thermoplasmatota archaeon]
MSRFRLVIAFMFLFLIFVLAGLIIGYFVGDVLGWLIVFACFAALVKTMYAFFLFPIFSLTDL